MIKYCHELSKADIWIIQSNARMKWAEFARFFPQPEWCGHPSAVMGPPWRRWRTPAEWYDAQFSEQVRMKYHGCRALVQGFISCKDDCNSYPSCCYIKRKPIKQKSKALRYKVPAEITEADIKSLENMPFEKAILLIEATQISFLPRWGWHLRGAMGTNEFEMIKKILIDSIKTLIPEEQRVIILRFGLDGGGSRTLAKIGLEFKVTGARISEREGKALRKLGHPTRSKGIEQIIQRSNRLEWRHEDDERTDGIQVLTFTEAIREGLLSENTTQSDVVTPLDPDLRRELDRALEKLPAVERKVLKLRFGIDEAVSLSRDNVAEELKMPREKVRYIEAEALKKLRHPKISVWLKDYF